jgi:segregation and condensation protein A
MFSTAVSGTTLVPHEGAWTHQGFLADDGRVWDDAEVWEQSHSVRRLNRLWLDHLALVPNPAYPGAVVQDVRHTATPQDAVTGDTAAEAPTPSGFAIEVPGFAGPFRLLADLILEQKVDVCDVPIATVTDGFLRYAKDTAAWNLEEATWFLAICAVLLELKIARLTPKHTDLDEEDLLGASPDLAYARSIELRAFRKVAVEIARRLEDEAGFFTRDVGPGPEYAHLYPDPMEHITSQQLAEVAAALLRPPPTLDLSHVTPIRFTVTDAIQAVEAHLVRLGQGPASFRELTADCEDRMHVVVRFLALLELYRDGKVEIEQAETFGEIEVAWRDSPVTDVAQTHDTRTLEALLFVSDEPLTPAVLSQAMELDRRVVESCATDCKPSWRPAAPASCCAT